MIEEVGQFGCECIWIPFNFDKRKRHMVKAIPAISKALKRLQPDVVHTHLFDDSLPGLIAAKRVGIKTRVITKGDTGFHYFFNPRWVPFDRLNNRNATHIVAISSQCSDFIVNCERGDAKKIHLIHHGIPLDEASNQLPETMRAYKEKYQLNGKLVIGNVGRLIRWKGHHHIVEAARTVVEKFPNAVFLFVGNGEEKSALENQINEAGLTEHFIFIDWVEHDQIPSIYGLMDLYVHAANHEPFGFVIAEALANGVSVISTKTGAAKDAVRDGVNGYLVDEENVADLAQALIKALGQDRETMRINARKTATGLFDFNTMWSKHIRLYRKALNREND